MADLEDLAARFRIAGNDHQSRSAFYSDLNLQIADDPAVVELLGSAPAEQQLPVLLLAAVHSIVLAEPDIELAAWYSTTAHEPLTTDPYPAFARLCRERADDLRTIITSRTVQTNEVGRCALLMPALSRITGEIGPIAMIDVGTSAGLNLQLDRYAYRYSPGGDVGGVSEVVLECGTRGAVEIPTALPPITSRIGIDRDPIDVGDPDDARWLMACVWPDQPDRFHRLRAAIDIARVYPAPVVRGDALDALAGIVRAQAQIAHPVIVNSWVLNYLPPDRRTRYVEVLDQLGADHDISWVYAESPGMCPELPFPESMKRRHITVVMEVTWRSGVRGVRCLGTAHPHGYWLHAAPS
jgi:hypothetical protein